MEASIQKRIRAGRKILFSREDDCLRSLQLLIDACSRKAVVCWALELAGETAGLLDRQYPGDHRAGTAVAQTWRWARGEIKMPEAKKAILACHAAAKECPSPEDSSLFHAVAQACSTVHTKGHAMGYPIYELTALARRLGPENRPVRLEQRVEHYRRRLLYWNGAYETLPGPWAAFLSGPEE